MKLKSSLSDTRAIKFHDLLVLYRHDGNEQQFIDDKKLTKNAFNVLKSRLYEKIQLHLLNTEVSIEKNFLLQIFNIPHLLFCEEREIALAVLEGIEKEFKQHNLFQLLLFVYQAQKKLSHGSPRYYHYSKLYNRNVAMILSQDKADDELAAFNLTLSRYYHSKDKGLLTLIEIHKNELNQLCRLNDTPRIRLYKTIMNCSSQLLCRDSEKSGEVSVDENLRAASDLLKDIDNDLKDHFQKVINYLYFIHYSNLGLQRDALQAINKSFGNTDYRNYHPLVSVSPYPDHRIALLAAKDPDLDELIDPDELSASQLADENEVMNYITAVKHDSIIYFINDKKTHAFRILRDLLNYIPLKTYPFSDVEIKVLFLVFSLSIEKEINQESILSSLVRRTKEFSNAGFPTDHLSLILKLLRTLFNAKESKSKKAAEYFKEFRMINQGPLKILPGIFDHPSISSLLLK